MTNRNLYAYNISMNFTKTVVMSLTDDFVKIISYENIRHDLEELIIVIHSAFEDTPRIAKQFFEDRNEDVDPFLVNDLIRYYVKQYLLEHDFNVTEDYQLDSLPNNGLSLRYKGYHVRILKADHGDLPIPGHSIIKQQFYAQQLTLDSLLYGDNNLPTGSLRPNVLILWELTNSYDFKQLYLACPMSGNETRKSVSAYFKEAIEHVAYLFKPDNLTDEIEDDDVEIVRIDVQKSELGRQENESSDIRRED